MEIVQTANLSHFKALLLFLFINHLSARSNTNPHYLHNDVQTHSSVSAKVD